MKRGNFEFAIRDNTNSMFEVGAVTHKSYTYEYGDNAGRHTEEILAFKGGAITNARRPRYGSVTKFDNPEGRDTIKLWEVCPVYAVRAAVLSAIGDSAQFKVLNGDTLLVTDGRGTWLRESLDTLVVARRLPWWRKLGRDDIIYGESTTARKAIKKGWGLRVSEEGVLETVR